MSAPPKPVIISGYSAWTACERSGANDLHGDLITAIGLFLRLLYTRCWLRWHRPERP